MTFARTPGRWPAVKPLETARLRVFFRSMRTFIAALALVAFSAPAPLAHAALPPGSYTALQKEAPEFIEIEVTDTRSTAAEGETSTHQVTATVTAVTRSASGLKPGDRIQIHYQTPSTPKPIAGPIQPPVLAKGHKSPAWLRKAENARHYEPAAYGLSFRKAEPPH
jgi:hypothetical protein